MKHLRFTKANRIEFEAKKNRKNAYRVLDAILEAKLFLKENNLDSCDLIFGDYIAEIDKNTDSIETIKDYLDHINKTRVKKIPEDSFIASQISKKYKARLSEMHEVKCQVLQNNDLLEDEVWVELLEDAAPFETGQRFVLHRNRLIEEKENIEVYEQI
jgi:hypothetical protein